MLHLHMAFKEPRKEYVPRSIALEQEDELSLVAQVLDDLKVDRTVADVPNKKRKKIQKSLRPPRQRSGMSE